jgi:hypothetical protein
VSVGWCVFGASVVWYVFGVSVGWCVLVRPLAGVYLVWCSVYLTVRFCVSVNY